MGEKIQMFLAAIGVSVIVFVIMFRVYGIAKATIPRLTIVAEKTETVEAVITDAKRHGGNTTFVPAGKGIIVPCHHPEWYSITVSYNDKEYTVKSEDEDAYDEYKTKIGETVSAELVTKERKDGSVTTEITSIIAKE